MIRSFRGIAPKIAVSAYVDPSAVVIGDVAIGARSSIWPNVSVRGDTDAAIQQLLTLGPRILVQKRGAVGSRIHLLSGERETRRIDVPGFPVEVQNILGAGDAFAAGFIYGVVNGWDWYKAVRMGNACGAILVTKHGCANFMPTYDELMTFIQDHGGF